MDRPAFIAGLIGTPYNRAGRHCWWLAGLVEAELFGRTLPIGPEVDPGIRARAALIADHPERHRWHRVDHPDDGDLALLARVPGRDIHCGVYLADRLGIIHTDEPHGVVIDTPLELEQVRRWRIAYHRPNPTA